MSDLLGNIFENDYLEEDNCAIDILQEQARLINIKSKGIIKATFKKVEYKINVNSAISAMVDALSSINELEREETEDDLKNKKDINSIYSFTNYKFEIYNDTYKFRIFVLSNRAVFPIELTIDEGICEELNFDRIIKIESNSQLEEIVSKVFQSRKIRIIMNKMMEYKTAKYESEIIKLLSNSCGMTIAELSEKLLLSRASTTKIIKKLEESEQIESKKEGKNKIWVLKYS